MHSEFYRRGTDPAKTATTFAARVSVQQGVEGQVIGANANRVALMLTLLQVASIGSEEFMYVGPFINGVIAPFASISDGSPCVVITPEVYGPDALGEIGVGSQGSGTLVGVFEVSKVA